MTGHVTSFCVILRHFASFCDVSCHFASCRLMSVFVMRASATGQQGVRPLGRTDVQVHWCHSFWRSALHYICHVGEIKRNLFFPPSFSFHFILAFSSKSLAASDGEEKRIYINRVSILIFHMSKLNFKERDEWDARTRFSNPVWKKTFAGGGKTRAMTDNWLTSHRHGGDRKITKSERIINRHERVMQDIRVISNPKKSRTRWFIF